MQDWEEVAEQIQRKLTPRHRGILKCQGDDRRDIVSNDGRTISMRTGVETNATKSITYQMIKHAFDRLKAGCVFDSLYFRKRYFREYRNRGSCLYSMVGGVLVELKLADRLPKDGKSCYYALGKGLWTK